MKKFKFERKSEIDGESHLSLGSQRLS
jgi:hypothetical protein